MERCDVATRGNNWRLAWLLVFFTLLSFTQSQAYKDVDPKCTTDRRGMPACGFITRNCYSEGKSQEPAWKFVTNGKEGPVDPYEGGYVYLDPVTSQGKPRKMVGVISGGKKAICALFYYASTGNYTVPINIYIQHTSERYRLAHTVQAQTFGKWQNSSFSCCLPNVKESKLMAIEATSTLDGVAAIDYVDIRLSDLPCENDELVCYPSVPSKTVIDPVDAPTCAVGAEKIDFLSCDFNSGNKTSSDYCGWEVKSGWDVRQKWDGTGVYDTIYSTEAGAVLNLTIPDDLQSVCVEVQFATSTSATDLDNVFSVHLVTQAGLDVPWGAAYTYINSQDSVWKRNCFGGILPDVKDRQIVIKANTTGLKIDYVYVRNISSFLTTTVETITHTPIVETTEIPINVEATEDPATMKTTEDPTIVKTTEDPTTVIATEDPTTVKITEVPTTVKKTEDPTTVKITEDPTTVKITEDPTTVKITEDPTTVKITEDPTTVKITEDPTTVKITEDPTTVKITEDPTTVIATEDPTSVKITEDPTTVKATEDPTTVKITEDPTTVKITEDPTTVKITEDPTTVKITEDPTTVKATEDPTTVKATEDPTTVKITEDPTTMKATEDPTTVKITEDPTTVEATENPPIVETTENPPIVEATENPPTVEATENPPIVEATESPAIVKTTENPTTVEATENPAIVKTTENPPTVEATENPPIVEATEDPAIGETTKDTTIVLTTTKEPTNIKATEEPTVVETTLIVITTDKSKSSVSTTEDPTRMLQSFDQPSESTIITTFTPTADGNEREMVSGARKETVLTIVLAVLGGLIGIAGTIGIFLLVRKTYISQVAPE